MTTTDERATEVGAAPTPSRRERAPLLALAWPLGLFVFITTFTIGDLEFDLANHLPASHVEEEIVALAVAIVGVLGTTLQLLWALRRSRVLQRDLLHVRSDAQRCRVETETLRRRFGAAIEHAFAGWGLTCAEKEIALYVLRGLSYKEVAAARGTAERTVRHQAVAIYRKAGVAGRAEMAALFLRDILDSAKLAPEAPPQSGDVRAGQASFAG